MSTVTVIPVEPTSVSPPAPTSTWILAVYDATCKERETAQDFNYVSLSSPITPPSRKQYLLTSSFLLVLPGWHWRTNAERALHWPPARCAAGYLIQLRIFRPRRKQPK
jgi:hypothetical protein